MLISGHIIGQYYSQIKQMEGGIIAINLLQGPSLIVSLLRQFFWGASTSSYQVEGKITNNDWHFFTTSEKIKK